MKTPITVVGQGSDEEAIESVAAIQQVVRETMAAIERIGATSTTEIQRLQVQVQRNLERIVRETKGRAA